MLKTIPAATRREKAQKATDVIFKRSPLPMKTGGKK